MIGLRPWDPPMPLWKRPGYRLFLWRAGRDYRRRARAGQLTEPPVLGEQEADRG